VSMSHSALTILVNRVVGLGVEHPADRETVGAIVGRYADAGVERFFLHLDPHAAPDVLPEWLEEHGLAPYR